MRQLSALGFTVRRDIATEAETARKFYRHGMVLRQVANFYNNIASEMIPCQKPMMLDASPEVERTHQSKRRAREGDHMEQPDGTGDVHR